jgi:hypothetical protein
MRLAVLLILVLPLLCAATFIDAKTGEDLTTGILRVEGDGRVTEQLVASATLPEETSTGLLLLINTDGSETYNYYAKLPPGKVSQGIVLHASGLLLGTVRDLTDNLLVGKPVKISCPSHTEETVSDASGHFRAVLPLGNCSVAVSANGYAGSATVMIEGGKAVRLSLLVDQPLSQEASSVSLFWVFLFVFVIICLLVLYIWTRPRELAPATKDRATFLIVQHKDALKEKEKLVADELLLRDGKMSLVELRRATRIPRTSLLRCIEGLEQRGLVLKKSEKKKPTIELVKK